MPSWRLWPPSLGAAVFKLNEDSDAPVKNTQVIGIIFIIAYMACDSFTSNWQARCPPARTPPVRLPQLK